MAENLGGTRRASHMVKTSARPLIFASALLVMMCVFSAALWGEYRPALKLLQTVPMPKVKGRLDHMHYDLQGQRLFVAALENGSLEVIDLRAGKWASSIPGFKKPQGVWYVPRLKELFIASGDDGMLRIFRGNPLTLAKAIPVGLGANRIAYDPHAQIVYVGFGGKDAGKDYGEVGIVNAKTDEYIGAVRVLAHPAELLLDKSGKTLFVFIPTPSTIQVVDTRTKQVRSAWPVSNQRPGDAAIDDATQRLMAGTRTPPEMIVLNSNDGKQVANLPTVEGMDGVYFDAKHKRIYVSGGRGFDVGFVYSYQQRDGDHYDSLGKISTRPGAGTSLWIPELNRYYVAAPATASEDAAILVYEPQP